MKYLILPFLLLYILTHKLIFLYGFLLFLGLACVPHLGEALEHFNPFGGDGKKKH